MTDAQHDALSRVKARYPAALSVADEWAEVVKLVKDGKEKQAMTLAASVVASRKHLVARNATALRHRRLRLQYLEGQLRLEREIKALFAGFADTVGKWLVSAGGDTGVIPAWKMKPLLDRIKKRNRELFAELLVLIRRSVKASIKAGVDNNMVSAQTGLEKRKAIEEADKKATIIKTSNVYKSIFDAVAARRLEKGLFKNRKRGDVQVGKSLSQQVWDLRDANLKKMRDTVASGIASGRASTAIASDIKKFTVMGGAPRGIIASPGPGVYRTAYKNALRLARTETNSAYHEADIEYATRKGFKKMWHVSVGLRPSCGPCEALDGRIFDPEDVPALPHPNCSCYLTTIIPGVS